VSNFSNIVEKIRAPSELLDLYEQFIPFYSFISRRLGDPNLSDIMKCTKNTSKISDLVNSSFVTGLSDAFSTKKKHASSVNSINPHFVTVRGRRLYSTKIARTGKARGENR
jgi:hypothetical protein